MTGRRLARVFGMSWLVVSVVFCVRARGAAAQVATVTATDAAAGAAAGERAPRAVLQEYCFSCHNERRMVGDLALDVLDMADVAERPDVWDVMGGMDFRFIDTRHEQAAVHMADAWGRITGQPGVAMYTTPGFANTIPGLSNATRLGLVWVWTDIRKAVSVDRLESRAAGVEGVDSRFRGRFSSSPPVSSLVTSRFRMRRIAPLRAVVSMQRLLGVVVPISQQSCCWCKRYPYQSQYRDISQVRIADGVNHRHLERHVKTGHRWFGIHQRV